MPKIEELDEKGEVVPPAAPARKKGQKKTEDELRKELEDKIAEATKKAREVFNRREKAKSSRKNKAAKNRNVTRREIIGTIKQSAANAGVSLTNDDIKVPSKGAKKDKIADYFKKAKAAYYKRTKKVSSLQRNAEAAARNEGLNMKYVAIKSRHKTVADVLKRAREFKEKNETRTKRKDKRARAIAMLLGSDLGYANEKEVMTSICVREKKKKE